MATIVSSTSQFDKIVKDAGEKLVVIDFTASWCPPCKMIAPTFDALAKQHAGKAFFVKVDVDEHGGIAQKYGVRAMPTFVFLRKGGILDQLRGANVSKLTSMVAQYMDKGTAAGGAAANTTFPGQGNSLSGTRTPGAQVNNGSLFGQIPRENLMPFVIIIAYLVYIVYSRSS